MRQLILFTFLLANVLGEVSVESQVQETVRRMLRESGKVTFSDLYNDSELSSEERRYLGRLYEVLFAIPAFLRDQYRDTETIPTTSSMADHFGISQQSILLLLEVLESDSRVPDLYNRNPGTGEIVSLNLDLIEGFLKRRGGKVRITEWEGMRLPDFQVTTLDDKVLAKNDLLGQNLIIYFWFTGCPPCVQIAPILAALAEKYESAGIQFYGLNADDVLEIGTTNESRLSYLQKQGLRFPNANLDSATREAFGNVNVYPTLFFVDKDGIIVRHLVNFQTQATLTEVIEGMLE